MTSPNQSQPPPGYVLDAPPSNQLPAGYVLDPPPIYSTSHLSQADLQALHDQAQQAQAQKRPANPFDQFDPPPAKAANPFDQFDPPTAPKAGGSGQRLTDAQLLSAPGPTTQATDAQLLAAPGPTNALPPGFTLDPPPDPGLLGRVGGIIGRGVLEGASGIAGAAQTAGRFVDAHSGSLPAWVPGSDAWNSLNATDKKLDNVPVQQLAETAADKAGFYRPQQASGKILEGAVGGATGAALTGGVGLLPMSMAAGAGAAVPGAKAAGASDQTAADIGLATSLIPVGALGAAAARNGAASLAKNLYVASLAKGMTPEQAMQQVMLHDATAQYASASGGLSPAQAAQGYGQDLNSGIAAYRKAGVASGALDADQSGALTASQNAANAGTGGSSSAKGLGLPDYHQNAVQTAVGQLDALNSQAPNFGRVGPLAATANKIAPAAAGLSALGAVGAGNWTHGAELAAAAIAGRSIPGVTSTLNAFGAVGDALLGSSMTPQEAQLAAAQRVFAKSGLTAPSSPLTDLQSAVSDVRGTLQDQANNTANATADALQARQTATAYAANTKTSAAAEAAWQGAMQQQAKQQAAGQADPLSTALWRDAEQQQQANSPNLSAVTASQVKGFQADQSAVASRDAQEQAADTAAQQRGQSLSEQAAAWVERQQIAKFQVANPGVPVSGAGVLGAQTPQQLFEATAGRFGSPADPVPPQMTQPPVASLGAPKTPLEAPTAASTPSPASALPAGSTAPSMGNVAMPAPAHVYASPLLPQGSAAMAAQMYQGHFGGPGSLAPLKPEIDAAVNDLAADGAISPVHADAILSGQNLTGSDREGAMQVAARVHQLRQAGPSTQAQSDVTAAMGNPSSPGPASQASNDVQQAMSGGVPNGGQRGPILNLTRYQGAADNYQRNAQQMLILATSPAEKQAISEIAATPSTAAKAAIRDAYVRTQPGADLSRFTPTLMRGT